MPEVRYRWTAGSPIGPLCLLSDGERICGLHPSDEHGSIPDPQSTSNARIDRAPFRGVLAELDAYFAGRRATFSVPIGLWGTPFQQQVWRSLLAIPFGSTISYAELARRIGEPKAVRAVGAANGRNPISIIVPCHRVIGSSGGLTGYSGGLDRKRWLLRHEAHEHVAAARLKPTSGDR